MMTDGPYGGGTNCLFCHGALGWNEGLEHLPVGRRIAFDPMKGRLWVICWRCTGWNLVPLQLRWEAVEECERRFEAARQRYATEHVGLARLPDGMELVRVGAPSRPEFAAWRYGERFGRRRRLARARWALGLGVAAVWAGVGGAVVASGVSLVCVGYGYLLLSPWFRRSKDTVVARLPHEDGAPLSLTSWDLRFLRLLPGRSGTDWQLDPQLGVVLTGEAAAVGLTLTLPLLNRWGGKEATRRSALALLEASGDPARYLEQVAARASGETLASLPVAERLALEMAVNEEGERRALTGELKLLELAWREAEQVAAIADRLLVPPRIESKIAGWRSRQRDGARGRAGRPGRRYG